MVLSQCAATETGRGRTEEIDFGFWWAEFKVATENRSQGFP
jgi:hypothetical protein